MSVCTIRVLACCILLIIQTRLHAQEPDSVIFMSAIVYDGSFHPVPATHVININTHQGDVTDSLGIFHLPVHPGDTLFIRNIAFRDTLVPVLLILELRHVILRSRRYQLQEARIFEWGSSYNQFRDAIVEMPNQQTFGASMGLPTQDPDYIPYEMNEKVIKSVGFLITSPISFFYQNFNNEAKSARKVYWLKKNNEKYKHFDELLSGENLSYITGLYGDELLKFQIFLANRMVCDFKCTDLKIYEEIHGLWNVYQELEERGML